MPHGNNPYRFPLNPIEEPIWRNNHFSVGKSRKLRNHAARSRKPLEPA